MKMKRTMAGILAVAMAASAVAMTPVSAASAIGVSVDKVSAKAGESFSLSVSLDNVPSAGLGSCEFELAYDSSIVTVTGVEAGKITETGSDAQSGFGSDANSFECNYATAGVIDVTWSTGLTDSSYWIKDDGVLLTITGTVNSSAKAGDVSAFKLQAIGRENAPDSGTTNTDIVFGSVDESGTVSLYETTLSDGSVTVVADSTTTVTTDSGSGTTTTTTTNKGDDTVNYGDLDMDGIVDLRDAITLNKSLSGQITLSDQATKNADVNCDGAVTDDDSSILIQFCIMLVDTLPLTD